MAICTTVLRITSANVLTEVLLIQGSVLGPILFLLFINDLIEHCATYSEIYLFADDAHCLNTFLVIVIRKCYKKESMNCINGQLNGY